MISLTGDMDAVEATFVCLGLIDMHSRVLTQPLKKAPHALDDAADCVHAVQDDASKDIEAPEPA